MNSLQKFLIGMSILIAIPLTSKAQSIDYRAQTLFIYNFIKYINWPQGKEEFKIAVLGESPIFEELKKLSQIKKAPNGKQISVIQIDQAALAGPLDIIYVTDNKSKEIKQILSIYQSKPTLIIGQREGLVKKGASIDFVTLDEDKLGFEVSRTNITNQQLKLSGELMRLAILID